MTHIQKYVTIDDRIGDFKLKNVKVDIDKYNGMRCRGQYISKIDEKDTSGKKHIKQYCAISDDLCKFYTEVRNKQYCSANNHNVYKR